jgi:hypothetical protein
MEYSLPQHKKSRFEGKERRSACRVVPQSRLFVSINGSSLRIADISAGGITLQGQTIAPGSLIQIDLHLGKHHLRSLVKIVRTTGENLSHGQFHQLRRIDQQALQDYVNKVREN